MNAFSYVRTFVVTVLFLAFLFPATGCSKKQPPHVEQLPNLTLGVVEFTMPRTLGELLAGAIPADQAAVSPEVLQGLDETMQEILKEMERPHISLGTSYKCYSAVVRDGKFKGNALEKWTEVGRCMKADVLLVPQLLFWQEREGGPMGVENPASVTLELYLLDVRNSQLLGRYRFEETQTSLTSNLLTLKKFVNRGGKWITANQLAAEGIRAGLKDLGL